MKRIKNNDLRSLAAIYNEQGRAEMYRVLREEYHYRNTTYTMHRMLRTEWLGYDADGDVFRPSQDVLSGSEGTETASDSADGLFPGDAAFLSIEELCACSGAPSAASGSPDPARSSDEELETLVHQLISDRLLEMSRYVTIDTRSRTLAVDQQIGRAHV